MSSNYNPYSNPGQSFPPYGNTFGPPPRQSGSSFWVWVIGGIVVLGGVSILACCGGLVYFGMKTSEAELLYSLRDHPVIQEHIGEVEAVTMNFSGTMARDDDAEIYDIVGSKGSGEITAFFDDELNFASGTLRMPGGETYELD